MRCRVLKSFGIALPIVGVKAIIMVIVPALLVGLPRTSIIGFVAGKIKLDSRQAYRLPAQVILPNP